MSIRNLNFDKSPILKRKTTLYEKASMTARRREYAELTPVAEWRYTEVWHRAFRKLRGIIVFRLMNEIVQWYGTGNHLTNAYGVYTANLPDLIRSKKTIGFQRMETHLVEIKSSYRGFINPNGKFKQFWNFVMLILLLYTFTIMPYMIAFMEVEMLTSWWYLDTAVDILFACDIAIILNTPFQVNENEPYIHDRGQIFKRYLKGMLIIDVVAIFPFSVVTGGSSGRSNVFVRFLRMARLTRIMRASKIAGLLKHFGSAEEAEKIREFLARYAGVTRIGSAIFIVLLLSHFTACMWFFTAKLENFNYDTWVWRYGMENEPNFRLYLMGLYYAITTLTTVGYGDVAAGTSGERFICILWMMFGVAFYSLLAGTLASMLTSMDEKASQIRLKEGLLDLFAKDTKLKAVLVKQAKKDISADAKQRALDSNQRVSLLMQLGKPMRHRIAMTMYGGAGSHIRFFAEADAFFVANIVPQLIFKRYKKGDTVYTRGSHADEIYFLASGRVSFVYLDEEYAFNTMTSGSYFGEIEVINRILREFTVIAETKCQILIMKLDLVEQMQEQYPREYDLLVERATKKRTFNMTAKKQLCDLLYIVNVTKRSTFDILAGKNIDDLDEQHPFLKHEIQTGSQSGSLIGSQLGSRYGSKLGSQLGSTLMIADEQETIDVTVPTQEETKQQESPRSMSPDRLDSNKLPAFSKLTSKLHPPPVQHSVSPSMETQLPEWIEEQPEGNINPIKIDLEKTQKRFARPPVRPLNMRDVNVSMNHLVSNMNSMNANLERLWREFTNPDDLNAPMYQFKKISRPVRK